MFLDDLEGLPVFTYGSVSKLPVASPSVEYLRDVYVGIRKTFLQFSEFLVMYYLYRIEGVKDEFSIENLKNTFFTVDTDLKLTSARDRETSLTGPEEQFTSPKSSKDSKTLKCFTCNNSDGVNSVEKEYLNSFNFIFNLNHLPVFDQDSGSFVWGGNEPNWRAAMENITQNEEFKTKKPTSVSNGSFLNGSTAEIKDQTDFESKEKVQKESRIFLEELNEILKDIDKKKDN